MKNGSNRHLATVRIHYKKRIKNRTVLAYSLLTIVELPKPPFPPPLVLVAPPVFFCASYIPPQLLFACVSVFKRPCRCVHSFRCLRHTDDKCSYRMMRTVIKEIKTDLRWFLYDLFPAYFKKSLQKYCRRCKMFNL